MRISVFITSYNQRAFLVEAIDSVLAQTLQPRQIIVVDDCSEDGSQKVIAGYASRYPSLIVPIYHSKNLGVTQTRIDALGAVMGDYVTYVDGDDRFLPAKLEKELELQQKHPEAGIVFSNHVYVDDQGKGTGIWAEHEAVPQGNIFRQTFARQFPKSTLFRNEMVNFSAWQQIGFYDPSLSLYEDYDMRIRLTKHLRAAYCDEPLTEYRLHEGGLSRAAADEHAAALEYVYRKNEPLLQDLDAEERREVGRALHEFMGDTCRRGARKILESQGYNRASRKQALKHFFKAIGYDPWPPDFRLLLAIGLPRRTTAFATAMLQAARFKRQRGLD